MELKRIGYVISTRGLHGEMKIALDTSTPEQRFKIHSIVSFSFPEGVKEYEVSSFKQIDNTFAFLKLKDVNDISSAETLVKQNILAPAIEDKSLIYIDELIGYQLISPTNEILGKVESTLKIANQDYLSSNNHLVPLIHPVFYSQIDKESQSINLTEIGEECLKDA